jgi:hypothetical protein
MSNSAAKPLVHWLPVSPKSNQSLPLLTTLRGQRRLRFSVAQPAMSHGPATLTSSSAWSSQAVAASWCVATSVANSIMPPNRHFRTMRSSVSHVAGSGMHQSCQRWCRRIGPPCNPWLMVRPFTVTHRHHDTPGGASRTTSSDIMACGYEYPLAFASRCRALIWPGKPLAPAPGIYFAEFARSAPSLGLGR